MTIAATPAPARQDPVRPAGGRVEVRGLAVAYGDVVAVDHIDLDVTSGEFLTLLGPSGSGKTTMLMAIGGFVIPDEGVILLDGRDITEVPPYKRNVGFVFQSYALFPHMTVAQNIGFPLEMRRQRRPEVERKVKEVLELVRLGGFASRYPRQLSGGQQQRVALARALVYEAPLLLTDESLGALDKKLREAMQLEITEIHRRLGITVIHVTHDQDEALRMSTRIAVMNAGRIEQIGTPTEIYRQPSNRFVADFIGRSNFLEGTIAEVGPDGAGWMVTDRGLRLAVPASVQRGQKVTLAVRPEAIRLTRSAEGSADAKVNCCRGVLEQAVYGGASVDFVIALEGGDRVQATGGGEGLSLLAAAGDAVRVVWDREASVVLTA
jgi:spermidine/putrescine ABC transporter ATP-binding subunit